MNWSTRLRRWVRIRTPPVREASMKPTAATVLPAPVACSNQKRRSAPGSSGASSTTSSSSAGRLLPVLRLLVGGELLVLARRPRSSSSSASSSALASAPVSAGARLLGRVAAPSPPSPLRARRRARPAARPSARPACPESASTWCGLSSAPSRSFGGSSASRRSSPSSSEKSRRHSIEGSSAPVVELGQRGVERAAAGGARAPAPPAPRRRAGRARGRTPPRARCRRLMELPLARQRRWSWP